ncbi:MAG: hypothetical protein HYW25_02715 [Candidatus Aenigmarchaeota archaeon]|nr:hypothetical protein [Candidatus Aenigmarchaeota archaeon]
MKNGNYPVECVMLPEGLLHSMAFNLVERPDTEILYRLVGSREDDHFNVSGIHLPLTTRRQDGSVGYRSESARDRMDAYERAVLDSVKGNGAARFIGESHSHNAVYDPVLSRADFRAIREDMERLRLKEWLEIVHAFCYEVNSPGWFSGKEYRRRGARVVHRIGLDLPDKNSELRVVSAAFHVKYGERRLTVKEVPLVIPERSGGWLRRFLFGGTNDTGSR